MVCFWVISKPTKRHHVVLPKSTPTWNQVHMKRPHAYAVRFTLLRLWGAGSDVKILPAPKFYVFSVVLGLVVDTSRSRLWVALPKTV